VLLADSEYRHELEADIEPFKGLLLGLFFVSVGMAMDMSLLLREPWLVLALVAALLLVKGAVLWPLGRYLGGLDAGDALRLTALLACGGEFAFVVLKLAGEQGLLSVRQHSLLVLAITVSMALTPLLVAALARLLGTRKAGKPAREYDTIVTAPPRVIVAGYGRMGQIVARLLRAEGVPFVALDHSAEQMDMVQRFGRWNDTFYGDPARPELLRAAQADKAEVFVLAIDDAESALQVARTVRRLYPQLKIVARARNRQHAWRLMDLGIHEPVRETLYSSLKLGEQVLHGLGFDDARVHARVERFRQQDAELLRAQYLVYDDETRLVQTSLEALNDLQKLLDADMAPEAAQERQSAASVAAADPD
jgi:glutathione-regulated potassium-efflux system protein KefB